ncbi:MAG: DUF4251 domain-containing protein [Bacteroidales bacterium]|nr:DUF4251 domain-containing protein [Bacteroidales bacterium]
MKKLVLVLTAVFFMGGIYAQEKTDDKKAARQEKRRTDLEEQSRLTQAMLENKNFVLETDYLQNRYGYRFPVNSNINFVKVDSAMAVIQVGSNNGLGYNGVGGVTAKGRITRWDLKKNEKKNSYNLSMSVMTPIGIYDLHFFIDPSGHATARLTGLRSGNLTFDGTLIPSEISGIYEGFSI